MSLTFEVPRAFVLGTILASFCGCGAAQEEVGEPSPAPVKVTKDVDEPTFRVWSFGVLDAATREVRLPYMIGGDGAKLEEPCYQQARGLKPWETQRTEVRTKLDEHAAGIEQAILDWADEVLLPDGESTSGWHASYERPTVVHAPNEKVRLAGDQQCVSEKGSLPEGSKTVTTLFGAKRIIFKSPQPLSKQLLKRMRKTAKKAKLGLKPLRPKEAKRRVYELEINSWQPIWFAFGDLPEEAWLREFVTEKCEVNLVYDDPTPRAAECGEPDGVGFGVALVGGGKMEVRVAADGFTARHVVKFDEVEMIPVGGRVIVWVKPRKIDEGAEIKINSLVLDPDSAADAPPDSFPKAKWPPKQ